MVKEKNINKWIFIVPIIGILLTSFVLTNFFLKYIKDTHDLELNKIIKEENEKLHSLVKYRVNNIVKLLNENYQQELQSHKRDIKNIVDIGYNLISDTYDANKNKTNKEIITIIKEKLRELRFFENNSGYYIIFDFDGVNKLHPHLPSVEEKNYFNLNDYHATYFIRKALIVLKNDDKAYMKWNWNKPDDSVFESKTGYLRAFRPLNIFIGSAKYDSDMQKETHKAMQELVNLITFENGGYIFAYDSKGNTISHVKKDLLNTNRWELQSNGRFLVQDIINGMKTYGDYITYFATVDPRTSKPADKISYVKYIDDLDWVIGNGIYTSDLSNVIDEAKEQVKSKLSATVITILAVSAVVTILSVLVMFFVSSKLNKILLRYRNSLKNANESLENKVKQRTKELEESKKELKELVIRDPLTNLYNRRYFDEISHELILIAKRSTTPLCFAIVDIDFFKDVNDTYGHDAGDEILKDVAKILKKSIRETDVVSRIGGEEFAILFPDTNKKDAYKVCEKLRILISEADYISFSLQRIKFTISIGLTQYDREKDSVQSSLFKRADTALYEAKDEGRNRVIVKS